MRIRMSLAVAAAAASVMGVAPAAHAEMAGGVIDCDAPGHKQVGGAVLGAVLGGIAGSNLARNDRGTGTVLGATAGAAAGSYVGCRMQKSDARRVEGPAERPQPLAERDDDRDDDRRFEERRDASWGPPGLARKPHHMPPGLAKKYYGVGERLPVAYVSERDHDLRDPPRYGLRYAPAGYRWVRVGPDAYLVRTRTGLIAQVVREVLG